MSVRQYVVAKYQEYMQEMIKRAESHLHDVLGVSVKFVHDEDNIYFVTVDDLKLKVEYDRLNPRNFGMFCSVLGTCPYCGEEVWSKFYYVISAKDLGEAIVNFSPSYEHEDSCPGEREGK